MASGVGKDEPGQLLARQGSKLHAAMLSKEAAAQLAVPSFRVYYPVSSAGAVPFLWESQPGTPKNGHSPSAAALTPPLTPPPSYYSAGSKGGAGGRRSSRTRRPGARGGLLGAIRITLLRRRPSNGGSRTTPVACSSAWSSSSWSSSSSSSNASATMSPVFTVQGPAASRGHHRRAFSDGAVGDDDAEEEATPRCFWTERECCERRVVKGCGVAVAVRNALATVVGGKTGRRAAATTSAAA